MSKRKLSKQQSSRMKNRRIATQEQICADQALGAPQNGLVIARFGNQADVESETGKVHRCVFRKHVGSPLAGDIVVWREGSSQGIIESLQPRRSELSRPDSFGNMKAVAANIDCMVITMAILPEPHANLIDRYLVAATNLQLMPLIVFNKCDLTNGPCTNLISELSELYSNLKFDVIPISAKTEKGFEKLREALKDKTSVFVGQSGVGKSSILQALMPHEDIKIGELSSQVAKGRHTTTNAKLYHFPEGGNCIDSPGIREFGLWHLSPQEVINGFPDLLTHAQNCKFRDCKHTDEPGCQLLVAVENQKVLQRRFNSYLRIIRSLDEVTMKTKNRK